MWKRMAMATAAGAAWATTILDAAGALPAGYTPSMDRVVIAVACISMVRLFLWCHDRPVAQAYELGHDRGYEKGHREAMREFNLKVSPIRREARGLTDFNAAHRRRLNGARVDA